MNKKRIILVNDRHPVNEDMRIDLIKIADKQFVLYEAYRPLLKMLNKMKEEGLKPYICSSYRSIEKQTSLFNTKCQYYLRKGYKQNQAEKRASMWVAKPYYSEHHTGLALDIVSFDYQNLDEKQADTKEQQWLMQNSWKYGFILRYPPDKSEITHVHYEPWHYRYVGKEAARIIYEKKITLEEFLDEK